VSGPDRIAYWHDALAAADQPNPAAPAGARAAQPRHEIDELEGHLHRQLLALEEDDVSAEFRRRVAIRRTELESALTERRTGLVSLDADLAVAVTPDEGTVAGLLKAMPSLASGLGDLPQAQLRGLFDSLQLMCSYDPEQHVATVSITLVGDHDSSHIWSAPSAGFEPAHPPPESRSLLWLILRLTWTFGGE
jgi:hypothetical protein